MSARTLFVLTLAVALAGAVVQPAFAQPFRAVSDPAFFYSSVPQEFTNTRLIARSVWNTQWKIVIPAYSLLNNEQEGLNRFVRSVKDVQLFLRTYSHSGN